LREPLKERSARVKIDAVEMIDRISNLFFSSKAGYTPPSLSRATRAIKKLFQSIFPELPSP